MRCWSKSKTMGKLDLEWNLAQARRFNNYGFIEHINNLQWLLLAHARHQDWRSYNTVASSLNEHGAAIALQPVPIEFHKENTQMGMFDPIVYLTGAENNYVDQGDTFWLHNAKQNGMVVIGGSSKEQVKLLVSREKDGEQTVVYTAGSAIVNQVKRMDASDRARMPMELRLDSVPSKQGSPTNILTPADQPVASASNNHANGGNDF